MEAAERIAAKPLFIVVFNSVVAATWLVYGVDVSNIVISIVTAELVLLGLGANRRSQMGIHAKLDELIHVTSAARDDITHIEDLTEDDIQKKRI